MWLGLTQRGSVSEITSVSPINDHQRQLDAKKAEKKAFENCVHSE
jgi:hypothetical protein